MLHKAIGVELILPHPSFWLKLTIIFFILFTHTKHEVCTMFTPSEIYYEKAIKSYDLGIQLLKKYSNIPQFPIENHNNIPELREKSNDEFMNLKRKLILGVRKTHKHVANNKVSNYLVPYTSSRMYCSMPILLSCLPL